MGTTGELVPRDEILREIRRQLDWWNGIPGALSRQRAMTEEVRVEINGATQALVRLQEFVRDADAAAPREPPAPQSIETEGARAEARRWCDAFAEYGSHSPRCRRSPCDCGYAELEDEAGTVLGTARPDVTLREGDVCPCSFCAGRRIASVRGPRWQRCPVCEGTGEVDLGSRTHPPEVVCPKCNGHRVIGVADGRAPGGVA